MRAGLVLPAGLAVCLLQPFGITVARAADPVVSLITPDLLVGELEIEKPDRPFQRPPIAPAPQP